MRKMMILALVAMLAVAGTALASGRFDIQSNATFSNGLQPTTTDNDDSCDIGVAPAATLLLPYFNVDIDAVAGTSDTTQFTITNVSRFPQIAHVTVWTDWSFPILDFNIFLTGFDVQSIDLYDVIRSGIVAPPSGTSATNKTLSPQGGGGTRADIVPVVNTGNPNIGAGPTSGSGACTGLNLPGQLPPDLVAAVQLALTEGVYDIAGTSVSCSPDQVGGVHTNAIGYITIDVANTCSINLPDDPDYIETEMLFDNVLIGDYAQIDGSTEVGNFAQGNPLVHIRAVPEGGPAGSNPGTNLPYTFYDRYTFGRPIRTFDRRQPLPSTFAARWVFGGTGQMQTNYKIWREGLTVGQQGCDDAVDNSSMEVAEIVRFDEIENAYGFGAQLICSPCPPGVGPRLPETSSTSVSSTTYPPVAGTQIAGWMYINANNFGTLGYSTARPGFAPDAPSVVRASQNWVIVSMAAQDRYSLDFDAAWLGNGCSPAAEDPSTSTTIGPAGGVLVCPAGVTCVGTYSGTNSTP